jgi:trehalose 6-phosphate synthase
VRVYPVSVEFPNRWTAAAPPVAECRAEALRRLQLTAPGGRLAVGVDRLDYTKGIDEKFLAVERFLELHPELVGRFVFAQIAEPSRDCLPSYRERRARLVATAERVNSRFGGVNRPIVLIEAHCDQDEVFRWLRAADVCYVGSLHDGMNLVAKEFVASRNDERGVLVLSRFAGAASQLSDALIVNPYAVDDCAQALATALAMPAEEQRRRMRAMRAIVAEFDASRWAADMLQDAARLRPSSRSRAASAPSFGLASRF